MRIASRSFGAYPARVHPLHVRSDAAFVEILGRMEGHDEVGLDCEFHTEGRYYPHLCLVQLSFGEESWAVDPHRVKLAPLAPFLEAASVRKVLHDGRQDLPILLRATHATAIRGVFDAQVAAGFLGYGGSVGYGVLVKDIVGVELDKSLQVSDWTRELSDAQIDYALDDVRHLGKVSSTLRERLVATDRLGWAEEACGEAAARALTRPDPEKLYRRVASAGRLTPEQLGILREAAAWRDRAASSLDRPLTTIASDLALKSVALQAPLEVRALESVRGLGAGRNQPWARELIEAVVRGRARPEPNPKLLLSREEEARIDGIVAVLGLARRLVAGREGIAAEVLADQAELRSLTEWHLEGRPEGDTAGVLGGWRRAVLGDLLLGVLSGEVMFRVDATAPAGIALHP